MHGNLNRFATCLALLMMSAVAPAEETVVEFSGTGNRTTAEFKVDSPWILDWIINSDYDKMVSFDLDLVDAKTGVLVGNILRAKALGNGVPIGACLARGRAAEMMQPGTHGSTFGGNPLACRAAIAVLEVLKQDQLLEHAASLGTHILAGFTAALSGLEGVAAIRGRGLMIGIELDRPCAELVVRAIEQGLLINVTAERVIRLLPPLITTVKQADIIIKQVSDLIREFLTG